jgi:hypothetical protein
LRADCECKWEDGWIPLSYVIGGWCAPFLRVVGYFSSAVLDKSSGELKTPEVFAINPRGQAPSFKDGDVIANESLAALLYLQVGHDFKSYGCFFCFRVPTFS